MTSRLARFLIVPVSLLVCCGATSGSCNNNNNSSLNIGPSTGEVVGATVAAGAIVATAIIVPIEISKHHNIQGCVYTTPNGLELRTSDQKTYALSGATTKVSPGTIVHLHGDRQKHDKNAPGDQVFLVKEVKKTSGPCTFNTAAPSSTTTPASNASNHQ